MLLKNKKNATRYEADLFIKQKKPPMSTQLEDGSSLAFNAAHFASRLPQIYRTILNQFRTTAQRYVSFNLLSFSLLALETVLFFTCSSFLNSLNFALCLAALFLSYFSYFLLLFYFQAKKPEQLMQIKEQFIQSCRQHISLPSGEAQHHLSIAEALTKLSSYLQGFERNFHHLPPFLSPISKLIHQFAAYCYWEDVFKMKEMLLKTAVEEHFLQIRITPTDLEVHASLANTYVLLSKLYLDLSTMNKKKYHLSLEKEFQRSTQLAIEEFQILNHYAPHDPWVHEQLAMGYRDLNKPKEETEEVELLLKLKPQDKEILFHLGSLYFQQGQNAKGLQIYEELKQANYKRAADLIELFRN
jgi:tetratricopeptide (TPR) repeat protein